MRNIALICVLLSFRPPEQQVVAPLPLALTHVTVIDATGAAPKPDMTVLVSGGVIRSISRSTATQFPAGTQVINASGKYLIPGLWDVHVHWYMKDYLPLFIANGVTGVRQMWGFPFHQEWRKKIQSEGFLLP